MNTRKLSAVAVLVASLSLSACDDQVVPTMQSQDAAPGLQVPTDDRRVITVVGDDPPPSAPPAYQHYTWINVDVDVGWMDAHTAYGQAIVSYGANNATADIVLSVRNSAGAVLGTNSGHAAENFVFPGDHTLRVSTTVYVTPTCGSIAQGTASGTAFDTWMNTSQNLLRWGEQAGSGAKTSAQPACAPPTCKDPYATNYNGPMPCTYAAPPPAVPPPQTPPPPSGPTYPGANYPPTYSPGAPAGHWECTFYDAGTGYQKQACVWVSGSYDRLAPTRLSLSRLVAPGTPARTQSSAAIPSVFVIVSDQVPAGAIAVIERHKTGPLKNVLLIPSPVIRPAVFVAAMQALYDSRDKDGDSPANELSITLRGSILDQQIPSTDRDYAASFTAQISTAKRGNAASYGTLPIVEFKLGARR
jgi:hypothetical protein